MKETNLERLSDAVLIVIHEAQPTIEDYVDLSVLKYTMMNIYLNADTSKSLTNHIKHSMTIITTLTQVSVIWEGRSTNYKLRVPMCLYEDVIEDLTTVLSCIDICINRLLDQ